MGGFGFHRNAPTEVTITWLEQFRRRLDSKSHCWTYDDSDVFFDELEDGLPDENWKRADMLEWMVDHELKAPRGYSTKTQLLKIIDEYLNPTVEEEVEVELEPELEVELEPEPIVEEQIVEEVEQIDENEME